MAMTVYSGRETSVEGGQETVYEKVEALHLGVAIQAQEVIKINSRILNSTIGRFLREHGLAT